MQDLITKVTQIITREDGTEIKVVHEAAYGAGLHQSIGMYVLTRTPGEQWQFCSNQPAPGWKTMPREEYIKHGRSPMLKALSPMEVLALRQKALNLIGKPMSVLN